jgi:hypothetical protein
MPRAWPSPQPHFASPDRHHLTFAFSFLRCNAAFGRSQDLCGVEVIRSIKILSAFDPKVHLARGRHAGAAGVNQR